MISCRTQTRSSTHTHSTTHCPLVLTRQRYDFEYEDDDEQETGDVGIENKYYNAKQMKAENQEEAIEEFLGLPAAEQEKGDWCVEYWRND